MWVMSNLVSVHLETVLVSVHDWCMVRAKCTIGSGIIFGQNRRNSKVIRFKWKLVLVHLEVVLILTQCRCMICAEHTIGSKIILDTSDGTPR